MIEISDLRLAWVASALPVIDIEAFSMPQQSSMFLRGPSGSGKTTLLSLIAAIISPQSGFIQVNGIDENKKHGAPSDRFRADHIGLMFQQFNLLTFLSVLDNVTLPCRFSRERRERATSADSSVKAEAHRLLRAMQLTDDVIDARSTMLLSVGQQQRRAAARALIGRPAFIDFLTKEVVASKASLLLVSHDEPLASHLDRCLDLAEVNQAAPALRMLSLLRIPIYP